MASPRAAVPNRRTAGRHRRPARAGRAVPAGVTGGLLLASAATGVAGAAPAAASEQAGAASSSASAGTSSGSAGASGASTASHSTPDLPGYPGTLLTRGDTGQDVKLVQEALGITADGIFGPVTRSAVVDFQRERDLTVDGIVGPETWGALRGEGSGSGSSGGSSATQVSLAGSSSAASAAVAYAKEQVGDRYRMGAEGPQAFDCSGLTMTALQQAGVDIPRQSSAQAQQGSPVSRSELQPGDLMFFYSPVSHVGIYVGNGQMVAASNPEDGVEVVDVSSSYWRENFTTARRY